jgi:hypothetical protein
MRDGLAETRHHPNQSAPACQATAQQGFPVGKYRQGHNCGIIALKIFLGCDSHVRQYFRPPTPQLSDPWGEVLALWDFHATLAAVRAELVSGIDVCACGSP